jgi:hypothetical protein
MRKLARTERTAKNRRDSWPQTWMYYLERFSHGI